eukprot:scaffold146693_cov49-Prasinocladus_malaysianus.AAC.1
MQVRDQHVAMDVYNGRLYDFDLCTVRVLCTDRVTFSSRAEECGLRIATIQIGPPPNASLYISGLSMPAKHGHG